LTKGLLDVRPVYVGGTDATYVNDADKAYKRAMKWRPIFVASRRGQSPSSQEEPPSDGPTVEDGDSPFSAKLLIDNEGGGLSQRRQRR
jgi:hypothetical protein